MLWLEYRPTINWFIGAIALEWTASLKVEVRENLNFFRLIHFIAAKRTLTYCIAAIKWFHRNKWQIQERPVLADIWDVSYKVIVLVIRDALSCIRKNKSYNFLTQWTDKGAKKSIKTNWWVNSLFNQTITDFDIDIKIGTNHLWNARNVMIKKISRYFYIFSKFVSPFIHVLNIIYHGDFSPI